MFRRRYIYRHVYVNYCQRCPHCTGRQHMYCEFCRHCRRRRNPQMPPNYPGVQPNPPQVIPPGPVFPPSPPEDVLPPRPFINDGIPIPDVVIDLPPRPVQPLPACRPDCTCCKRNCPCNPGHRCECVCHNRQINRGQNNQPPQDPRGQDVQPRANAPGGPERPRQAPRRPQAPQRPQQAPQEPQRPQDQVPLRPLDHEIHPQQCQEDELPNAPARLQSLQQAPQRPQGPQRLQEQQRPQQHGPQRPQTYEIELQQASPLLEKSRKRKLAYADGDAEVSPKNFKKYSPSAIVASWGLEPMEDTNCKIPAPLRRLGFDFMPPVPMDVELPRRSPRFLAKMDTDPRWRCIST